MRANDIIQLLGDQVHFVMGDLDREIKDASSVFEFSDGKLTFCTSDLLCERGALNNCTIIVPDSFFPTKTKGENTYIVVDDARLCFARALKLFVADKDVADKDAPGKDSTAKIDDSGFIHASVVVGPHCVIGKRSLVRD